MTAENARFAHLEIVHPDPYAAADFLIKSIGAKSCEEGPSCSCEGVMETACKHVLAGGVVFQFIKPVPALPGWQEDLDANGPVIHNIGITVDNWQEVRDALLANGCQEIGSFMLDDASVLFPDAPAEPFPTAHIDAKKQCGLQFELMQNTTFWPSLTGDTSASEICDYVHHEIVHPDPHAAAQFMIDVLGAESCEEGPSCACEQLMGTECKHVLFGGTIFQFIKPIPSLPGWQETLDKRGPCIHNVAITVDDVKAVSQTLIEMGALDVGYFELDDMSMLFPDADSVSFPTAYIDASAGCGLFFEIMARTPYWPSLTGQFK